jgi:tetratricopeptide (TPR) repeat protein
MSVVPLLAAVGVGWSVHSHDEQPAPLQELARACASGEDDACNKLVTARGLDDAYALALVGPATLIHRLAAAAPEHVDRIWLLRIGADRFPHDASLHYELADAILRTGKNVGSTDWEAYGPLLRAVELEPDFVEALTALADVDMKRGRPDLAIERYRAAVRARPALAVARIGLGRALMSLRRPREAAEQFRVALELPALDSISLDVARAGLGETSFWLGDAQGALNALRQGAKTEPLPGPAVACIEAVTLWWLGREDEARRMCELSVEGSLYCNCQGRASAAVTSRPPTLTADDTAVVLATLSNNRDLGIDDGTETVVEGTSAFSETALPTVARLRGRFLDLTRQYEDQSIVAEAVEDLLVRSRTPAIVELRPDESRHTKALSRLEMQRMIRGGTSFDERFPKTRGFMTISRPGFSKHHGVAAIAVQRNADLCDGPVYLFVLDRQNETWRLRAGAETRR